MQDNIIDNIFIRTEMLLGKESMQKLNQSHIAIFGIGGVGSYTVEALARSGVGKLTLVDKDRVDISNINRQLIATLSTVGMPKAQAAKERIADINPKCKVIARQMFFLPETASEFDFSEYDYIIDAVDNITAKIQLIKMAQESDTPIISCMGAGNKLNPTMLEVADIYKTSVCPLARVMRRELKKLGIKSLKVVYSKEEPIKPKGEATDAKQPPASIAFVPSVAGLIIAAEVVKYIIYI